MMMSSSAPRVGVVVFPGSNCDQDCADAVREVLGAEVVWLWHQEATLPDNLAMVMLPGGFSYGDHLRCGAIAHFSPVIGAIKQYVAENRGLVVGICNGFQILTECNLLPGALIANKDPQFLCQRQTTLEVVNTQTPFTSAYQVGQVIEIPIAHGEGNYQADPETLARLKANGQVVFRYTSDVNGSVDRIAGIVNEQRNVLGMMPHPERNIRPNPVFGWQGDGRAFFASVLAHVQGAVQQGQVHAAV